MSEKEIRAKAFLDSFAAKVDEVREFNSIFQIHYVYKYDLFFSKEELIDAINYLVGINMMQKKFRFVRNMKLVYCNTQPEDIKYGEWVYRKTPVAPEEESW